MSINIKARGFRLTTALRSYTHAKLEKILSRYRNQLPKMTITLEDVNGLRGGEDMRCKIILKTSGQRALVIQETAADMYDAIAIASSRASWAVSRQLERLQSRKRQAMSPHNTSENNDCVSDDMDDFMGYNDIMEKYKIAY